MERRAQGWMLGSCMAQTRLGKALVAGVGRLILSRWLQLKPVIHL